MDPDGGDFLCEFYGGMGLVEVVDEFRQIGWSMVPDQEYVVDKPDPKGRLVDIVCIHAGTQSLP